MIGIAAMTLASLVPAVTFGAVTDASECGVVFVYGTDAPPAIAEKLREAADAVANAGCVEVVFLETEDDDD